MRHAAVPARRPAAPGGGQRGRGRLPPGGVGAAGAAAALAPALGALGARLFAYTQVELEVARALGAVVPRGATVLLLGDALKAASYLPKGVSSVTLAAAEARPEVVDLQAQRAGVALTLVTRDTKGGSDLSFASDTPLDAVFAKCASGLPLSAALLAEVERRLKPGGVFVFEEGIRGEWLGGLLSSSGATVKDLAALLDASAFDTSNVEAFNGAGGLYPRALGVAVKAGEVTGTQARGRGGFSSS